MTDEKTATEKLAELVRRKAAAAQGRNEGLPGRKALERAAAARSSSKAKPAMKKG